MVIIKTDTDAKSLPKKSDGTVDESAAGTKVDEIEDSDRGVGKSKSEDFNLAAGKYVIICNLPAHYAGGMSTNLTVQ